VKLITGQQVNGAEIRKLYPHLQEKFELATWQSVKVGLSMNETSAWVSFAGPDGKIDYSAGFYSKDARFREWCSDLFDYYWARSRKITLRQSIPT